MPAANAGASKKVLIVNTSAPYFGPKNDIPTGVWLEETSTPYYTFKEAGFAVELASIAGGPIPIDAGSINGDFFVESAKKFLHDGEALAAFCHSTKLSDVSEATDFVEKYDCLYLSGGHGTCSDFHDNKVLKAAIETFYAAGKTVCADCHGPIALAQCLDTKTGEPLVKGKTCTGFSNSEEGAVGQTGNVPFSIEDKFKEQGAKYELGADWNPKVCVDGNLITGQNPQSSDVCAKAVVTALTA